MSFIKDEENESSFWDWVILGAIVLGGLGFWFYYQSGKKATAEGFRVSDSLYQVGAYERAKEKYEELKSAGIISEAEDSILYHRLESIDEKLDSLKEITP